MLGLVGGIAAGGWPGSGPSEAPASLLTSAAQARDMTFSSVRAAYQQGRSAYVNGYYEIALPALEYVVARNDPEFGLFARFYLARIYADSTTVHTDHYKAYILFLGIADENANIDPDKLREVAFVAKALTAVAIYVRDGLPEANVAPDLERAVEYLRHAANFFNEPDAQFELAKIDILDERRRQNGLHFLSKLARESHPGAQAMLADLLARGKYMPEDRTRALALIKLAVENAPSSDRIWIADIYQSIYCAAAPRVREDSKGVVAEWRKSFAQPRSLVEQPMALGRGEMETPVLLCSNGESIELKREGPLARSPVPTPGIGQGLMPSGVQTTPGRPATPR